jgi:hypothetical protein
MSKLKDGSIDLMGLHKNSKYSVADKKALYLM